MIQIKRALDAWQSLRGQHIHLNQTSSFVSCKLNCSPQGVTADINAIFFFFTLRLNVTFPKCYSKPFSMTNTTVDIHERPLIESQMFFPKVKVHYQNTDRIHTVRFTSHICNLVFTNSHT